MLLKRLFLAFMAFLIGLFAIGLLLNPYLDHNPAPDQKSIRIGLGVFFVAGTIYILSVAVFAKDEYIDKTVTWEKFFDRLPFWNVQKRPDNNVLIRSGEARLVGWSRLVLYSGFNILPRSVFWSADFNGRSDNTVVISL